MSAPPAPVRLADPQPSAEWRFLVRHLYVALGAPPVAGYGTSQVRRILWGDLPPDGVFFAALLAALTSRSRPEPKQSVMLISKGEWGDPFKVIPTTGPETPAGFKEFLWSQQDLLPPRAEPPERQFQLRLEHVGDASPAMPGFAPPNPEAATTVEEFIEAMNLLKRWTGLSFRQLEEKSKTNGEWPKESTDPALLRRGWLPRASAADMLSREKLPKADVLWAFTSACGLPSEERDRWEAVRLRLRQQSSGRRRLRPVEQADHRTASEAETA